MASRPAPSPPQPAPLPAPDTRSSAYGVSLPAPAPLYPPQPQTTPATAAADTSVGEEGAAPQQTEETQFIQRSEESAAQDLLGSSLEPSSMQDSSAVATQQTAAAAFDPFGDVADMAQGGAVDSTTAGAPAAPSDPFLALERAASAMAPPSSAAQAERDAESELAAFRAELPAAEQDDAQLPSSAAPAAGESHLGSAGAAPVAQQPGTDVPSAPTDADNSSGHDPPVPDTATADAAMSHPADVAGTEAAPGSAAAEDPAAWAASWGNGSEQAAVEKPTTAAGESAERPDNAADPAKEPTPADNIRDPVSDAAANSTAPAAADQRDISADGSQELQEADDAPQPAADVVNDAELHPSIPNGLHTAEADAERTEPARDDPPPNSGLFAGLDIEAKPGDKGAGEQGSMLQSGSAAQVTDDEAQEGGF